MKNMAAEESSSKAIHISSRKQDFERNQPGFPTYLFHWAHISELRKGQQQQHLLLVVSHRGTSPGSGRTWTLLHPSTFGKFYLFPSSLSVFCKIPLSHHPPEPLFWTCHSAVNVEGRRSENLLSFWHTPAVICTRATQRRTQNNWKQLLAGEREALGQRQWFSLTKPTVISQLQLWVFTHIISELKSTRHGLEIHCTMYCANHKVKEQPLAIKVQIKAQEKPSSWSQEVEEYRKTINAS